MSTATWSTTRPCSTNVGELRTLSVLQGLEEGALEALARSARGGSTDRADLLWSEQEGSPGLAILVEGRVELTRRPASGKAPTAWWATAGDPLSLQAAERSAARLVGPGRVLVLDSRLVLRSPGWPGRLSSWDRLEWAAEALGHDVIFQHLTPGERLGLVAGAEEQQVDALSHFVVAGDPVQGVAVLLEGEVLLRSADGSGTVALMQPGEVLGALSWVANRPHSLHALAGSSPVRLLRIPLSRLRQRMAWDAGLRRGVLAGDYGKPSQRRALLNSIDSAAGTILRAVVLDGVPSGAQRAALLRALARSAARQFGDRVALLTLVRDEDAERSPVRFSEGTGTVVELARRAERPTELGDTIRHRLADADLLLLDAGAGPLPPAWAGCVERRMRVGPSHRAPGSQPAGASGAPLYLRLVPGPGAPHRGDVRLPRDLLPALGAADPEAPLPPVLRSAVDRLARALTDRRIGLALGGGGALALAHVPLLRALHSAGIPVDLITACGSGSLVGAFYAAQGLQGVERLLRRCGELGPVMARCLPSTRPLGSWVDAMLPGVRLEELELPLHPVAFDVDRVEEHAVATGSVGDGVRTSHGFPGLLAPRLLPPSDGLPQRRWLDGSIIDQLPSDMAGLQGARVVLASVVVAHPRPRAHTPAQEGGRFSALKRVGALADVAARADDLRRATYQLFANLGDAPSRWESARFTALTDAFSPLAWSRGTDIVRAHEGGEGRDRVQQALDELRRAVDHTSWRRPDKDGGHAATSVQLGASIMGRWTRAETPKAR